MTSSHAAQLGGTVPAEPVELIGRAKIRYSTESFSAGDFRLSRQTQRERPDLPRSMRFSYPGRFPDRDVMVSGYWPVPHPKYGEQLVVDRVVERADEADWVYRMAGELPDVGQVTVGKLRERFAASILDVLDRPQAVSLLSTVIQPRRASAIVSWWRELAPWVRELQHGMRTAEFPGPTRAATEAYLRERGLWGRAVEVALDLDGHTMTVPADPFCWAQLRRDRDRNAGEPLRVVDGVSLDRADRFAAACGVPASAPDRVTANAVALLVEAANAGHVCLPTEGPAGLTKDLCRKLRIDGDVKLRPILDRAVDSGEIAIDKATSSVYLPRLYVAERAVASGVLDRLAVATPSQVPEAPAGLSGEQAQGFQRAFTHRLSILTGPPGRGKSRTVVAIADAVQRSGLSVLLTAPTGRAAVRLKELAQVEGIQLDVEPGTVHRLLLARREPLGPRGLLVVEEAAMLDIGVAGQAFERLPRGWRVVLVGDSDQLAPVGPGRVLSDLVGSGLVPVTELSRNYRTDVDGLARAVDDIRVGQRPQNAAGFELRLTPGDRFATPQTALRTVTGAVNELAVITGSRAIDVLVVAPHAKPGPNRHTSAGNLNAPLRAVLSPGSAELRTDQLGVGDKVLHRRNDYRLGRFNGEHGVVDTVSPSGDVVVAYPDGTTVYDADQARDLLRLAFVSTVHRAQGGEADGVLVLLRASDASMLVRRRLIYTAVSRARRHCVVLAEPGVFERALADTRDDARHGNLLTLLRGAR